MANKVYKIVPGPMNIVVKANNEDEAFKTFEQIINRECVAGWTYHSMETIAVTEKNCGNTSVTNYYMLIFEHDA